jgi:hypothetical protein
MPCRFAFDPVGVESLFELELQEYRMSVSYWLWVRVGRSRSIDKGHPTTQSLDVLYHDNTRMVIWVDEES